MYLTILFKGLTAIHGEIFQIKEDRWKFYLDRHYRKPIVDIDNIRLNIADFFNNCIVLSKSDEYKSFLKSDNTLKLLQKITISQKSNLED